MSKDGRYGGGAKVIQLLDRPLSYPRAMARIRKLWREGKFTLSPHAEERLLKRRLDITDIENFIRYGRVVEHSKGGACWRYKVEGETVEQRKGGIVCGIDGDLLVFVSVMLRTWRN